MNPACAHPPELCHRPGPEFADHPWVENLVLCVGCRRTLLAPVRRAAVEGRRRARAAELRAHDFGGGAYG